MKTHSHESIVNVAEHESPMSQVEQMAEFVDTVRFEALGPDTRQQLRVRILDCIGLQSWCTPCSPHGDDTQVYQ